MRGKQVEVAAQAVEQALTAAIEYVIRHSTEYHRTGPTGERVRRGVIDLAVALYERRGVTQDPFEGIAPAMWLSFNRLLGMGRYAQPTISGGTP